MVIVEREVNRCLTLLSDKIRQRGYTQLEVQQILGWGRSYISQLVTQTKKLRLEQVLSILDVIGVEPADFFAELFPSPYDRFPRPSVETSSREGEDADKQLADMLSQVRSLVGLLARKGLIDPEEASGIRAAVDPEPALR